MAPRQIFTAFSIMAAIFPALVAGTDYLVGDDMGWSLDVDYSEWAKDKVFMVGDSLVFNYAVDSHNVLKVGGAAFKACNTSAALGDPLTSGHDVVKLAAPGRKWYICGIPGHCEIGMKLVINVLAMDQTPAPAPAPAPCGFPAFTRKLSLKNLQV